jgi:hypothetical protein
MGEDKLDETRAVTLAPMHPHSNLLVGGKKISRHLSQIQKTMARSGDRARRRLNRFQGVKFTPIYTLLNIGS